ncbi:MAG: hypothetical protein CTY12_00440 [Methylotenera sp.]|nr:MAG: hypothetical protein CTY12_00440 [Methylotenera sp.]
MVIIYHLCFSGHSNSIIFLREHYMSFSKTKYVVFKDPHLDREMPYIFPNIVQHLDFARCIGDIAISAGFCHLDKNGMWEAYGRSESLGLNSRPSEDSDLLNLFLVGN